MKTKTALISLLNNQVLRRSGAYLQRAHRNPLVVRTNLMRHLGIDVLLDIGAHEGGYVREARASGFRGQVFSFEPNPAVLPRIKELAGADGRWEVFDCALSDHQGTTEFNVSQNEVSSSILEMTELHREAAPRSRYVDTIEVRLDVLDRIVPDLGLLPKDKVWVKVDVQGAEDQVLAGARELLASDQCRALDLEISFRGVYEGQADYLALLENMRSYGFEVWDLMPGIPGPDGELLQADVLLAKS